MGHPHTKLRVNTLFRYGDRKIESSVDEFCSDGQPYETACSFFPRPIKPQGSVFHRHMQNVGRLIACYQDQVRRGELPPQE